MAVPTNTGDPVKYIKDSKGVYHPVEDVGSEDIKARLSAVEKKTEQNIDNITVNEENILNLTDKVNTNTSDIEEIQGDMEDIKTRLDYTSCGTIIAAEDSPVEYRSIADVKCSGTDDKDQINAAIKAMGENGGRIIFAPGTYNLDNSILVDKDNVTLEGIGNAEIIFALNQFNIQGKNIKIKNLNITADTAFQSTIGTEGKQGDFITIEDCNVKVNTAVMNIIANGIHVKFMNNVVKGSTEINFFGNTTSAAVISLLYFGNYSNKKITVRKGTAEGACNFNFTTEGTE